jgi:NAD-dependent dihydropyrimidine dehydrogenase PreA subunit
LGFFVIIFDILKYIFYLCFMSYIIGSKCVGCVDGSCLKVCPVDCIDGPIDTKRIGKMTDEERAGKQLYINPDVCIDCGACVPECPVDAIHPTEELAIKYGELEYVNMNYEFYGQKYNPRT